MQISTQTAKAIVKLLDEMVTGGLIARSSLTCDEINAVTDFKREARTIGDKEHV